MANNTDAPSELICASAPEPGQLAEVRRRQWVVSDIQGFYAVDTNERSQNYVTLNSIEDDALGEELEVVWEIEPGARAIEKAGLPTIDGQDDSAQLEAFLDAVRWGAATNADRSHLQAPFRSGVVIEPLQLEPLVRAIDMARVNLLIADDVGYGKTIEAGLVIQELLLRHRARTVFIVCPASLQVKWRDEMLEKFGLEFRIVNTNYIKHLRRSRGIHANPWTSFPRLITSMDWIKNGDPLRLMRDVLPPNKSYPRKFDILVVDEAHNVAPAGSANYALSSQRTQMIRAISPHFQHRLFLTATPHNGYTQSFTALLELLDDQRFSRSILPNGKQLAEVLVRRLKTDMRGKDGKRLFPTRNLKMLEIPYTKDEQAIHRRLDEYCKSREKSNEISGPSGTRFINRLLKKRLLSSPAAFAATLEKHVTTLEGGTKAKATPIKERILRKAILKAEEDYADDRKAEEAELEAVEEATKHAASLTDNERAMLDELRAWAQRNQNRADSKADAVIRWIEAHLKTHGQWNDRRVILFTEYRSTHEWLRQILASNGYGGDRLSILHGGMDQEKEREPVKAAFQAHPNDAPVRILLATDAASEGIDLQNHCDRMIHLEIPYNPNVMEQRNGRIDRWGQKQEEVLIWHPVDGGKGDGTLGGHKEDIIRALKKLESMREDMGSVNPVIAPQMSELIEGKRKDFDTREAEARAKKARHYIHAQRKLKEHIEKLHERLEGTIKDLHLEPERIQKVVETGLKLAKMPGLEPTELENAPSGTVFRMPQLPGSWAQCLEGLQDPLKTDRIRPITFDHDVRKGRNDVVLVHLNHVLVQKCLRLLRAEIWAQSDAKKLYRIDVCTLPNAELEELAVAVISRLVITGADHSRLHEELTISGGYLADKAFRREPGVTKIQDWLDKKTPTLAKKSLFDSLKTGFDRHEESIQRTIEARSKDRLKNLRNILNAGKNREIDNIRNVLNELARSIQEELDKGKRPEQYELRLTEDERTELRRDVEALKARLARIPLEIKEETAIIEKRYTDFTERTFPVSVVFLVPASLIKTGRP